MAAGDVKTQYASAATITCTLASLASNTNLLDGRGSNWVDNSSNKYLDAFLSGKITTGTSPTDARQIEVYVVGIQGDSTYPDVFDGTDNAVNITSAGIKNAICRLVAVIATNNTSNRTYPFGPVALAGLFGGALPKSWGVFVVHNTGAALNSTGSNHALEYVGVYENVAQS